VTILTQKRTRAPQARPNSFIERCIGMDISDGYLIFAFCDSYDI
jgi:hypothetical protein